VGKIHPMEKEAAVKHFGHHGKRTFAMGDSFDCACPILMDEPTVSLGCFSSSAFASWSPRTPRTTSPRPRQRH
jgi:hypothetical protein